ncbi:YopT-type cysteine protease domain-containing protein [Cupriavidus sp. UYPR2.512]|uniref:YopT-type cysteine protease domain-containing protein n=1 Tax=Cupriavidus sp. UYPR2.512 TaxID=1080187 RepID=UPI0012FA5FFE|nr:YopT-type cysteine protease domain-containing protein [Cupriavidus sp. UYPR2.512]
MGSSSTSSPTRLSTSFSDYRTAELSNANANGICVGLTAAWLLNRNNNSAPDRMAALMPGSVAHGLASQWQEQYQTHKAALRSRGMSASQADLDAQNAMLNEAGLKPSGREKKYRFNDPMSLSNLCKEIAKGGSTHLLSLYFASGNAHIVATSTSNGQTVLFDPNYGEFNVASHDVDSLIQSLSNRYKNPNRQHLSTVTTQRVLGE